MATEGAPSGPQLERPLRQKQPREHVGALGLGAPSWGPREHVKIASFGQENSPGPQGQHLGNSD